MLLAEPSLAGGPVREAHYTGWNGGDSSFFGNGQMQWENIVWLTVEKNHPPRLGACLTILFPKADLTFLLTYSTEQSPS